MPLNPPKNEYSFNLSADEGISDLYEFTDLSQKPEPQHNADEIESIASTSTSDE